MSLPDFLFDGPKDATMTIALAHGAGAAMDSPFMQEFAERLAGNGFRVARFEFPYMTKRRADGTKRPPNRAPVLVETWNAVTDKLGAKNLIIGGKSMGGRMASMVMAEREQEGTQPAGLVCLGYHFHPPGKPKNLRVEHLRELVTPALICQGTRDTLGNKDETANYMLSLSVRFHWLEDGDHGFKPRQKSGLTEEENWTSAISAITDFANGLAT